MAGKKQLFMTALAASLAALALPSAAAILTNGGSDARPLSSQPPADHAGQSAMSFAPPSATSLHYVEAQIMRKINPPLPPKQRLQKQTQNEPVNLTADQLEHDEEAQTITATGHVELVQAGRILRADKVVYSLNTDTVSAKGHVVMTDNNGDVHFADEAELTQKMGKGFVKGLESYLSTGGRFTAKQGSEDGPTKKFSQATYTPCECEEDGRGKPAWQIRAKEMIYHEDTHRIAAKDARFEFFGVPAMWTPFISLPDGKEKRKSGFLTPQLDFRSNLGAVVTENYYWNIAPDRDATTGMMVMTNKEPVALATYRQRFDQAQIKLSGSTTYSDWTDSVGAQDVDKGERWRGNFFANGVWDINDLWRAGADVKLTSDDEYLREYNISHDDILVNQIYAERFSGRDYAIGKLLAFQDVRTNEGFTAAELAQQFQERSDQPDVLPQLEVNLVGDPNATLGGRWNFDTSLVGLHRNGTGLDVDRVDATVGWQRRFVTDFGVVSTLDAGAQGDFYYIYNRAIALGLPDNEATGTAERFVPHMQLTTSYPMAKPYEKMQAVVEPIAAVTVSSTNNVNNSRIPDEDSQDVQLDANNIFNASRFPGLDRVEDGTHITYGARTGLYGYDGGYGNIFLGQSERLTTHDNPFPVGSGLSNRNSDVVGQVAAGAENYGLNYRFQLDSGSFAVQRNEVSGFANWDKFRFNTRYVFTKALEGTDIALGTSREQVENNISYDFARHWRGRMGAINALDDRPGLRRGLIGLDYFGCCMSFNLTAERNIATDASGDNGTTVSFRIGLKGLGGYDTPNKEDDKSDGLWRSITGK
jgi:LPS-assembly protein